MKLNKFVYLYSKPLGNHTLKIMKKIPGNLLKKPGKIMEISWNFVSPKKWEPCPSNIYFRNSFIWILMNCRVAVLIYNKSRNVFVFVKQFRPGKCKLQNFSIITWLALYRKSQVIVIQLSAMFTDVQF